MTRQVREQRECRQCGVMFTPKTYHQTFCCDQHRVDYHNEFNAKARQMLRDAECGANDRTQGSERSGDTLQ